MSIAWMTRVWAGGEPTEAADRLLMLALADNANDAGVCWPSIATLARKCAVGRRALIDTLGRLEAAGFLVVVRTSGKGNVYRLVAGAVGTREGDRTGADDDTGAPVRTGGREVPRTGPVQRAAPEPSENPQHKQQQPARPMPERRGAAVPAGTAVTAAVIRLKEGANRQGDPVEAETADAAAMLTGRGLDAGPALALARKHGASAVRGACGRFDADAASGRGHTAGWLVAALRDGYASGDGHRGSALLTYAAMLDATAREGTRTSDYEAVPQPQGKPMWRRKAHVPHVRGGAA